MVIIMAQLLGHGQLMSRPMSRQYQAKILILQKQVKIHQVKQLLLLYMLFTTGRNDGKQNDYDLWLWGEGQNGRAYAFNSSDDYGISLEVHSSYFYGDKYLNLIIRH